MNLFKIISGKILRFLCLCPKELKLTHKSNAIKKNMFGDFTFWKRLLYYFIAIYNDTTPNVKE